MCSSTTVTRCIVMLARKEIVPLLLHHHNESQAEVYLHVREEGNA
jgi:hypothetical protein